jgi:hypothetical protein
MDIMISASGLGQLDVQSINGWKSFPLVCLNELVAWRGQFQQFCKGVHCSTDANIPQCILCSLDRVNRINSWVQTDIIEKYANKK